MVSIDEDQAGQRVDNFLLRVLKGVPRSRIYRILRRGEVRVNKGRVKPTYKLKLGDQVRIPPVRTRSAEGTAPKGDYRWLESRVIYEDAGLIVLDKPTGMAVHGGSGVSFGVIEALRQVRDHPPFLELVHRLDRDTSGCLMIAKKRSILRQLHERLREGRIRKHYLALVRGSWQSGRHAVTLPLLKIERGGERVVVVNDEGKFARTWFKPVNDFGIASLVDAELDTGRTHQIRVHATESGHPLAGDPRYGTETFNRDMAKFGLNRLFLHAHSLSCELENPVRSIDIQAPLGEDLRGVLDRLEEKDNKHEKI